MRKTMKTLKAILAITALGAAFAFACGSEDEPTPQGHTPDLPGGSGGTDASGGTPGSAGSPSDTGGTGGTETGGTAGASSGGTTGEGGSGTGGGGPAACKDPTDKGCFDTSQCTPVKSEHFLNACNGKCVKFDNTELPLFKDGKLPPLK
jgi:hypothetical protein